MLPVILVVLNQKPMEPIADDFPRAGSEQRRRNHTSLSSSRSNGIGNVTDIARQRICDIGADIESEVDIMSA